MHIQMQIRYPNISFLFSLFQAVFSSGEARDDRCFTCLYSAITSFLHHEYSIHSHVGMHILYAARFMCSERFIFHSLAEHSGFLFAGSGGCRLLLLLRLFFFFFMIPPRTEHCRQAFSYYAHHFVLCSDMSTFDV